MDLHKAGAAGRPSGSSRCRGEDMLASLHLFSFCLSVAAFFPSLFLVCHCPCGCPTWGEGQLHISGTPHPPPLQLLPLALLQTHTHMYTNIVFTPSFYPATVVTVPHPTVCRISFWAHDHWKSVSKSAWIIIMSKSVAPKVLKQRFGISCHRFKPQFSFSLFCLNIVRCKDVKFCSNSEQK